MDRVQPGSDPGPTRVQNGVSAFSLLAPFSVFWVWNSQTDEKSQIPMENSSGPRSQHRTRTETMPAGIVFIRDQCCPLLFSTEIRDFSSACELRTWNTDNGATKENAKTPFWTWAGPGSDSGKTLSIFPTGGPGATKSAFSMFSLFQLGVKGG